MNNKSLVSVIIPFYNRIELLLQSLTSVIDQTYRPLQVILIDDGSTDNCSSLAKSFISKHESSSCKITLAKQMNLGASAARNKGLELATGDYIQFLDSDDLLKKDKIAVQVESFQNSDADIVVCDYERLSTSGKSKVYSNFNPLKKVLYGGSLTVFTPLFRSEIAKAVKWDVKLKKNQDADYILKSFILTNKIGYVPGAYCIYREHEQDRIRDSYKILSNTFVKRIKNVFTYYRRNRQLIDRFVLHHLLIAVVSLFMKEIKYRIKQPFRFVISQYSKRYS